MRPGLCSGGLWIDVQRTAPETFTGNFVFPSAGTWTLVSFPQTVGPIGDGYPDRISVRVGGLAPGTALIHTVGSRQKGPDPAAFWIAFGLLLFLAIAGVVTDRRRRAGKPVRF
jgi:hypothetical protein